mgnify:CR=1 FL=1
MGIWARFEIIFSPLIIGFPVSGIEEEQKTKIIYKILINRHFQILIKTATSARVSEYCPTHTE